MRCADGKAFAVWRSILVPEAERGSSAEHLQLQLKRLRSYVAAPIPTGNTESSAPALPHLFSDDSRARCSTTCSADVVTLGCSCVHAELLALMGLCLCGCSGSAGSASSVSTAGVAAGTASPDCRRWAVVVASGGHFAATVFELAPAHTGKQQPKGEPLLYDIVAHKTFHRYVVRQVPLEITSCCEYVKRQLLHIKCIFLSGIALFGSLLFLIVCQTLRPTAVHRTSDDSAAHLQGQGRWEAKHSRFEWQVCQVCRLPDPAIQ